MRASTISVLATILACSALPAAALDYDPYDVGFDGTGFDWRVPGDRSRIAVPAARRVTFRFNATSDAPCVEVKSAVRIFVGGELYRTVYLEGREGCEGRDYISLAAPNGTAFEVFVRALVRVPVPTVGGFQGAAPKLWAIADGPMVLAGTV